MRRHRIRDAAIRDGLGSLPPSPDGSATAAPPSYIAPVAAAGDRFLRWPDVHALTGLSRTSVWRAVRRGDFPPPRRLTTNTIGWLASEVDGWFISRAPTRAGVVAERAVGAIASAGAAR